VKIEWTDNAIKDYQYWGSKNIDIRKRINSLVRAIVQSPFTGIGRPEILKHGFAGHWSRRINREHRLIYRVSKNKIIIIACRYHYK